MADSGQFGGGKMQPFGDRPGGDPQCVECEAKLADAFDGTLSAADQARFDLHAASCDLCGQMVADARRGAAWLELLRNPAPEPPAHLLERILAQTSWPHHAVPVVAPVPAPARLLAFPRRTFAAVRRSGFGQIVIQPRLAMTAAMAFFSIALTMNITGVHPTALRLADLEPGRLRRDFFSANARVVQYYEGLRVVYELESRVHDLEAAQDTDTDRPLGNEAAPAEDSSPAQPQLQHQVQPEPIPNAAPAGKQSQPRQHERSKSSENPRTSRREDPFQTRRMVVAETLEPRRPGNDPSARPTRRLA